MSTIQISEQVKRKQTDIPVEGVNWNVNGVLKTDNDEASFVKRHMDDVGTYKDFNAEKKEKTLKLVWKLVQENNIEVATSEKPPRVK